MLRQLARKVIIASTPNKPNHVRSSSGAHPVRSPSVGLSVCLSQWRNQSERATWSTDQQATESAKTERSWVGGESLTETNHRSFLDFHILNLCVSRHMISKIP